MEKAVVNFSEYSDDRGCLVSIEENIHIPFAIKRVYYIFGNKQNLTRGGHAHKELKQVLICVSGSCTIMLDDGLDKREFHLSSPNQGLLIERFIWREMKDFSKDCVLLVLADAYYKAEDYVRSYDDFINLVRDKEIIHD
ncbi:sugar 3,4-ketoisomerase [Robertmurraya massiliosenegalensis]|uniref:sugar 3,4-ketoisomerase n=1 Tax=Robertmurraya massiliosenegalensis TaxID=1287657 RepID=UPI00031BC20D|nr:FdtA/QdtA family cupin domain-containing protein [Robertmurraya massiliosenegalensis]